MEAVQCLSCHYQQIRPIYVCPVCTGQNFQEVKVADTGKVYSYTTIHVAAQECRHEVPYTVLIVEMDAGFNVTGRLMGTDSIAIGERVTCARYDPVGFWFKKANN